MDSLVSYCNSDTSDDDQDTSRNSTNKKISSQVNLT